jgi:leader peptidase (prepilin peptidase)/N-methyltransferase
MIEPQIIYPVVLLFFGMCVGSFLNVVIYRLPEGLSVIHPGSRCPGCNRELTAIENIPVFSWLIQRAKCRGCGSPIHWRYPGVELATGILWATVGYVFCELPVSPEERVAYIALCLWFVSFMMVIIFIDLDLTVIPDKLNMVGITGTLIASAALPSMHGDTMWWLPFESEHVKGLMMGGFGMMVGGGVMYMISLIATFALKAHISKVRKGEDPDVEAAIGFGDVKLVAFIGAFLGWKEVLLTFSLSSILGSVCGILTKMLTGSVREHKNDEFFFVKKTRNFFYRWASGMSLMPYGPFLCLSAILILFLKAYINFFVEEYMTFIFYYI